MAPEWVDSAIENGVTSLISRSDKWKREGGVRAFSSAAHEHSIVHRAVHLLATVDGLNVKNLVGVELLLRRRMLHEEAIAENPENLNYEGADLFLGISESAGGAYTVPSLRSHVASELGKKAAIMKEKRKAREARDAGVASAKAKAGPQASPKA